LALAASGAGGGQRSRRTRVWLERWWADEGLTITLLGRPLDLLLAAWVGWLGFIPFSGKFGRNSGLN
jgi:hypothetical protein